MSEKSGSMRINTFPMKDLHNGRSPMSYEQHKDAPVSEYSFGKTIPIIYRNTMAQLPEGERSAE